ncbi:MAG: family 4 glycosyl hydrolase [Anaerolineales bacterium]
MTDRIKLVILGGSSLSTPLLFEALAQHGAQAAYDIVLVGRDTERLELVLRVSRTLLDNFPTCNLQLFISADAERALEGADFCLNQIRPGGLEGRAFDESFPRDLGIPGEETLGPGGFSSACRSVPAVLGYCRMMERVAPQVILINLTNPCSLIQYAVRRYTRVNVIGLCELPVLIMERVAALLNVRPAELEFELGGMNHFSWITAIQHAGRDRLPQVLARIEQLPKLGVEPDLARALGVIPSPFMRFYFHPDRVLAETAGKTVRARELIALGDEMLADFQQWTPNDGALPATLRQRGAVWYDKIVAPVLLALAEKRSAVLPLNVENNGAVPCLPNEAIVEVLAPIAAGEVQPAPRVELPPDAAALLRRHCVFEMLAAEAIVERDRDKALRALLSNPLVQSYDQAEQISKLTFDKRESSTD